MEWISVNDELPAIGQFCIVHMERRGFSPVNQAVCQYTKYGFDLACVTHWMSTIKSPKTKTSKVKV